MHPVTAVPNRPKLFFFFWSSREPVPSTALRGSASHTSWSTRTSSRLLRNKTSSRVDRSGRGQELNWKQTIKKKYCTVDLQQWKIITILILYMKINKTTLESGRSELAVESWWCVEPFDSAKEDALIQRERRSRKNKVLNILNESLFRFRSSQFHLEWCVSATSHPSFIQSHEYVSSVKFPCRFLSLLTGWCHP